MYNSKEKRLYMYNSKINELYIPIRCSTFHLSQVLGHMFWKVGCFFGFVFGQKCGPLGRNC
jgi:hypothetical protein